MKISWERIEEAHCHVLQINLNNYNFIINPMHNHSHLCISKHTHSHRIQTKKVQRCQLFIVKVNSSMNNFVPDFMQKKNNTENT